MSHPVVDAVIPARDEQDTVARNVSVAAACRYVRQVIVVDDGSVDATAAVAEAAGALVVRRVGQSGSKAHAMRAGVDASDADLILFVDADCLDLTADHLDHICEPVLRDEAEMSIGLFDYGPFWNPFVQRLPSLSGERIVPRWVFDAVPPEKLDGFTIESRLNEVVGEARLRTVVWTMPGVFHRTKRVKFGRAEGVLRTIRMFRDLLRLLRPFGDVRWRAYAYYRRGLTIR
jgi:glycosyltransferase involved in cell wall biosynthesis